MVALSEKNVPLEADKSLPRNHDLYMVLVSNGGRLWRLGDDFSLIPQRNHATIGSGYLVASGAVEALRRKGMSPYLAAREACRIAVDQISTCGGRIYTRHVG